MLLVPENFWAFMTIWSEARGEPFEGKVAVAEVIRNRMKIKHFSDGTVPGTVLYPFQFSCWNTQDPNRIKASQCDAHDPIMEDCVRAWYDSLISDHTKSAVLYYSKSIAAPDWVKSSVFTAEIGNHRFYRLK